MIGLEYVLKLYDMKQQELADKLEIKQQNIDSWIKGKRNIPKKWMPKLVNIFNIPEEYFQKELNDIDKVEIQMCKLDNEWIAENNKARKKGKHLDRDIKTEQYHQRLEYEIAEAKVINKIKNTLLKQFKKAKENNGIDNGLLDSYLILSLYQSLVEIIEKETVSIFTLMDVLKGIKSYQDKTFDEYDNDFVKKITDIIKEKEESVEEIQDGIKIENIDDLMNLFEE